MPKAPRVSAGIIPFRRDDGAVLILRAFRNWDFPKGMVEKGESAFEAALRELEEETGLTDVSFPLGKDYYETEPYAGGKVARFFLGEIGSGEARLLPARGASRAEHHELRWTTPEEASTLLGPRLRAALAWALDRRGRS